MRRATPRIDGEGGTASSLGLRDGQRGFGAVQGLILPLSACTNAPLAAALGRVVEALPRYGEAVTGTEAARVKAAMAGSGLPLVAEDLAPPGGRVVLDSDVGLFSMLSGGFRYVSAVMDDPGGTLDIAETAPFRWPRPVDFMEWLYTPEHRQWWVPVPYLIRDGAAAIGTWSLSDQPFSRLSRPELRIDRLLRPRADVVRRPLSVRVTADRYGWAELVLRDGAQEAQIALSNVYPPLEDLAEWTARIARGDLPLRVEIDEEGSVVTLTALPTGEEDLLLLLATDRYGPEVRFQGLVSRPDLATAMASAMLTAFADPAQAQGWSEFFGDDGKNGGDEEEVPDPRVAIRRLLDGILDRQAGLARGGSRAGW